MTVTTVAIGCATGVVIYRDFNRLEKSQSHTNESVAKQYVTNKIFQTIGRWQRKKLERDTKRCQEVYMFCVFQKVSSVLETKIQLLHDFVVSDCFSLTIILPVEMHE